MPKLNTYTLNTAVDAAFQMLGIIPGSGSTFQTVRVSPAAFIAFIQQHSAAVDGREVEMQKSATHVQWRYVGDATWIDLIPLADITGSSGANGADGDEVEMRTNSTHVQWKLLSASVWNNLIPLADLKGEAGTGLTNRGVWAAGTFNPGDYVFATGSIGSGNAMWVLSDSAPYASSVQPKDDPTRWIEQAAPAGPAGDDGLSVELQKSATHIQWRQTGGTWADLVLLADLVGAAGSAGAAGAKWHTGTDVPAAGTGVDGDFYLRSNGDYYGPKASGAWGAVVDSLKGSAGDAGSDYSLTFIDKGTGAVASTQTFDVAAGAVQRLQVEGALTVAFINWKPAGQLSELLIELVNGASAVITGLNGIRWIKSDGSYTTTFADSGVSLQTSGTDWVFLWTRDGGATIWGKVVR